MRSAFAIQLALVAALVGMCCTPSWGQSGEASIGASYSSLFGPTGRVSLRLSDIGEHDSGFEAYYRGGPDGAEGRITAQQSRDRDNGELRLEFRAQIFDWDHLPFESTRLNAEVLREFSGDGPISFAIGGFAGYDDVTGVASRQSALLSRDLGSSATGGLVARTRYETGDFEELFPSQDRRSFVMATRLAALGDRNFAAVEVGARVDYPVVSGIVANFGVEGGVISGLEGSYVAVQDRAFQGNDQPRGFEYGGLGPRDPVTDAPLGGTNYYSGTIGLSFKPTDAPVVVSTFADFGSTWNVPGVSDPLLDDGHAFRASVGVAVDVRFEFGAFQISFAEAVESQPFDQDQIVSVSLGARF